MTTAPRPGSRLPGLPVVVVGRVRPEPAVLAPRRRVLRRGVELPFPNAVRGRAVVGRRGRAPPPGGRRRRVRRLAIPRRQHAPRRGVRALGPALPLVPRPVLLLDARVAPAQVERVRVGRGPTGSLSPTGLPTQIPLGDRTRGEASLAGELGRLAVQQARQGVLAFGTRADSGLSRDPGLRRGLGLGGRPVGLGEDLLQHPPRPPLRRRVDPARAPVGHDQLVEKGGEGMFRGRHRRSSYRRGQQ